MAAIASDLSRLFAFVRSKIRSLVLEISWLYFLKQDSTKRL